MDSIPSPLPSVKIQVIRQNIAGGAKEVTSPPPPSLQSSQSLRLGFLKLWSFNLSHDKVEKI